MYITIGDFRKAALYMQLAHEKAIEIGANEIIFETYAGWADIHENLKDYKEALRYRKLLDTEKGKLINKERINQLAEMEARYQSEKKKTKIITLQRESAVNGLIILEQSQQIQKRNYVLGGVILLILLVVVFVFLRSRSLKLHNLLKKQRLIHESEEKERLRISRDIHDDFGSGLSKINMLSEIVLVQTLAQPEVTKNITAISETAKSLIENMKGLIWALNSGNTTADQLMAHIREYSSDYLESFPIKLVSDYPDEIPASPLNKEVCHALFMTVKEALNNIVKHSQADHVEIMLSFKRTSMLLHIRDNGKGFNKADACNGNGLRNMKSRIEACGALLSINSAPGKGSEICITISLTHPLKTVRRRLATTNVV